MKSKKGVTLIALVITIIVLLILAGVSISLVVGDSGVFTEADQATSQTDLAGAKEALERALVGRQGDFTSQWDGDDDDTYYKWLETEIKKGANTDETAKTDVLVEDGYIITLSTKAAKENVIVEGKNDIIGTIQKAQKDNPDKALDSATKYVFELGNVDDSFLGVDIYAADLTDDFFGEDKAGGEVTKTTPGTDPDYTNTVSGVEELDNVPIKLKTE